MSKVGDAIPHCVVDGLVGGNFSLLLRVLLEGSSFIDSLTPSDMDELVEQAIRALERCSVSESDISEEEQLLNEWMVRCVYHIDCYLMGPHCGERWCHATTLSQQNLNS
jgi:hypothetical protein